MDIAVKIVNVVATAVLDRPIDLECLPHLFPCTLLCDPRTTPPPVPVYFKSKHACIKCGQGKVSIFASGKIISIGTKNEKTAKQELISVANRLMKAGVAALKNEPKVVNMVATVDLGFKPDIESISNSTETRVIYEPEQFPGAIIHLSIPGHATGATVLLFASGKAVCVGLKKSESIYTVIQQLLRIIV